MYSVEKDFTYISYTKYNIFYEKQRKRINFVIYVKFWNGNQQDYEANK